LRRSSEQGVCTADMAKDYIEKVCRGRAASVRLGVAEGTEGPAREPSTEEEAPWREFVCST
jgi:hypothetical protein